MIKIDESNTIIQESNIPGWFNLKELSLLYSCVIHIKAMKCIEIGTFWGRSTYASCLALKRLGRGKQVCVDLFGNTLPKEWHQIESIVSMMSQYPSVNDQYTDHVNRPRIIDFFNLTMDRYPFMKDFVELRPGDSRNLDFGDEEFDLALIDGDHTYQGVSNDFFKVLPHIRDGGVIVCHDNCQTWPEVMRFIEEVKWMPEIVLLGEASSAIAFQIFHTKSSE